MIIRRPTARIALYAGLAAGTALALTACATSNPQPPLQLAPQVDVPRYMGAWYLIGVIPTFIDKDAYNAVERYTLNPDGTVDIHFSYRNGAFDGEYKTLQSKGFVQGGNGAVWGVQFVWPIKADYRIMSISDSYDVVMVGREKRDYLWIMSRQPTMPEADYQRLAAIAAGQGYDTSKLIRSPQRW